MYSNVIVGVDGQQGGRDAAALAATLAEDGTFVTLVYVSTAAGSNRASNLDLALVDQDALPTLLVDELRACGGDAQLERVLATSVGAGLEDAAERCNADLIVVGRSRRHGIARLISGDDVRSVLHQTPCAVAVAPASYASKPASPRRIGVAFDLSPESEIALAHAGLLADQHHATLAPFHVVEPHYYAGAWGVVAVPADSPDLQLAAAAERIGRPYGLEVELVYGSLGQELVAFGDRVDVLVCGSRRNGLARRIALGSTSEYLAGHVSTPLVITPVLDTASVERWRAQRRAAA